MPQRRKLLHWIGGEYADSGSESVSVNPANGQSIGTYADGDAQTMQRAIDAAEQGRWRI
jgi:betaine-aldehyde dehydrogenase